MLDQSSKRLRIARWLLACAGLLGTNGCRAPARQLSSESTIATVPDAGGSGIVRYPYGRWRIGDLGDLSNVVLWVSHIVIGFEGSEIETELWPWKPLPAPTRSRSDAEALIQRAAEELRAPNADFGRIAERFSDDVVTRDRGGSLGGVRANQLPIEYRDAIEQLKMGGISGVFATPAGLHIIKWREPPSDVTVAGERLVIGYQQGNGSAEGGRTRHEALHYANQLADDAAQRRSVDTRDGKAWVDMGDWSTRDPEFSPREIEELANLEIGEVSRPLDTHSGFQLLRRVPVRQREAYVVDAVYFRYSADVPTKDDRSRDAAHTRARALLKQAVRGAHHFATFRHPAAHRKIERWSIGRAPAVLTDAMAKVEVGQFLPAPVDTHQGYVVARRLEASVLSPPRLPRLTMPSPVGPNFAGIVQATDATVIAGYLKQLANELGSSPIRREDEREVIATALTDLADRLQKVDRRERGNQVAAMLAELRARLEPSSYDAFVVFVRKRVEREMLQQAE